MLTLRRDRLFELYCNLTIGILLHYLPFRYVMKVPNPTLNDSAILLSSANGLLAVYLSEDITWKYISMWVINFPVIAVFIGLPSYITKYIYSCSSTLIIGYLVYLIFLSVYRLVNDILKWINLVNVFGFYNVAKPVLDSIQQQLIVFWLATYAYSAACIVKETTYVDWIMSLADWITFFSTCFEKCCRTYVGLMATSVVVARAISYASLLLKKNLYDFRKSDRHVKDTRGLPEGLKFFFFLSINFGVAIIAYYLSSTVKETAHVVWTMSLSDWITFLSTCIEESCRTYVGLIIISVVVARATPYARLQFEKFLYGFRNTGRHVPYTEGLPEGLFFFLLCINFGVAGEYHIDAHLLIDVQHRKKLLKFTFFFVMAVFLDITYQMLDSKIMSFRSSTEILIHIRALMTYVFLLFPSFCIIYIVCKLIRIGTVLTLVCFSGSTIIQIVGSLLMYTLFLFNVKFPMENLNAAILLIRASVNLLIFLGSLIGAFSGLFMVIVEGVGWTPCLITHFYNMHQVGNQYRYEYKTYCSFVSWLAIIAYYVTFTVKETAHVDWTMSWSDRITVLSACFEKCCRTYLGLFATSVVIGRVTPYARLLLEKFLYGFREIDRQVHDTEGYLRVFSFSS